MTRFARTTGHLVIAIALALVSVGTAATPTAAADYAQPVPLHTWHSASRGDNFTTSNPSWTPADGTQRQPDYGWGGMQGYVLDPSEPQPLDTVPLYAWYSPSRGDNFVTTDPAWAGSPGDTRSPDYGFVRIEGFVFTRRLMGTVPLFSWYSPNRADNIATTNPLWSGATGDIHSPDYRFVRIEGYVYRSEYTDFSSFGYGKLRVDGRQASGLRPQLTMMLTFSDMGFREGHDRSWI